MIYLKATLRPALPLAVMLLLAKTSFAQGKLLATAPLALHVGYGKTVSISFPCAIKSVDRGSAELLAQKAAGAENVLLVKTAKKGMEPTSLMVITCQGSLYSFQVFYQQDPSPFSFQLRAPASQPAQAMLSGVDSQDNTFALALDQRPNLTGVKSTSQRISLSATGIYSKGSAFYLTVFIENSSMMDYQIENLGLFVRDHRQAKRTAIQQRQISPLTTSPGSDTIASSQGRMLTVAFPKLILAKHKRLFFELTEADGARSLRLCLKAKHLSKVRPL